MADHTLSAITFTQGHQGTGFQETDESGSLVALYDADGDQIARIADADRYPHTKWKLVKVLGTFSDSDDFWDLITDYQSKS